MICDQSPNARLATNLYFKGCDGTYVNAVGELLRMRYGNTRVLGADLVRANELYRLFDRSSWTDDLEDYELCRLFDVEGSE